MKKRHLLPLFTLVASCLINMAYADELPGTPASTNTPGSAYPRILPDNRVVFQVKAPEADRVAFQTDKTYPATKDEEGTWTVTTDPQAPGFHYYWLVIDGVQVNDPSSETFYGTGKQTSGIEIPEAGDTGAYYDFQDVPHGEVRERWYQSSVTQGPRRFFLYTPPGYDQSPDTRYPVLYLQHGGGEDERAWPIQGRVAHIMDNLIASGDAEPMLVVMERGYALRPEEEPIPFRMGPDVSMDELNRQMLKRFASFEAVIIEDVIPFIDSQYRTIPDRHHRAIAGFSMGGFQAYMIGLQNLDTFASIGGLSGTGHFGPGDIDPETYYGGALADTASFNESMDLMFFGHGTQEPDRMMAGFNAFHANLSRIGIDHVYYQSEGTGHVWLTERRNLRELAKRLFK
ncbi:alpha/beta hydrolase-fold protein [Pelagicoccus sp. SDUM812002]|uniref:alpha/beta hydrolase-fold protein n=1 Tax=Pelagicoccus sp. SDUM812002 TaxID=3041266 RepID=UPI00280FCF60|nr:alpha/beta hydrolase-fold protein [Pelagicoccus sp. SDUM812002]MDQ8185171.1 alpha/beta hydrolase-fold protein [Pelagicoccus sp. SDUM812002]